MHIRLHVLVTNLEKCKEIQASYDDKKATMQFKPANENNIVYFNCTIYSYTVYYKIFSVTV